MQQNFIQKTKEFLKEKIDIFKNLDKRKKSVTIVGMVTVVMATIFCISYGLKNKYDILFSGLDTYDAANITKELEDQGVDTKIKGDTIYVPKKEVDKLRLELSPSISNGSKGFELMDEGSNFSMTDEEFEIKKLRMLQGELEKTVKTFPQVEDAKVHITQGEESVFTKDSEEGKAAVYVSLKTGTEMDKSQVKSIMSLISASCTNIPKQNIEVIDQKMTLLSEGIYDEDGNSITAIGTTNTRSAEKQLNEELQKSLLEMLEPIFGKNKVKATVNTSLSLDTVEKTKIKIDPDNVIKSEIRSENSTSDTNASGSPVDNNMTNTTTDSNGKSSSTEESVEYEVGKTETKTITTPGEVKRVTASVVIDGAISNKALSDIEKMVAGAIGMDADRGDEISVVTMNFASEDADLLAQEEATREAQIKKYALIAGIIIIALAIIGGIFIFIRRRKENEEYEEVDEFDRENYNSIDYKEETNNDELMKLAEEGSELSLEDEIKLFASKSPQQVTELLKTWLNE